MMHAYVKTVPSDQGENVQYTVDMNVRTPKEYLSVGSEKRSYELTKEGCSKNECDYLCGKINIVTVSALVVTDSCDRYIPTDYLQ
ncbi:hypothetical protein F2P81_023848 [Scophthalmus maximus]|uniref:Uncharacterized protein n=1 Tax=Scophthalmus maximus TaxID=52904 RepID=A0A6A4RT45_SCOMX|nr:hypothetical protein F2P81_023848 [Scophthalmus maximus]